MKIFLIILWISNGNNVYGTSSVGPFPSVEQCAKIVAEFVKTGAKEQYYTCEIRD